MNEIVNIALQVLPSTREEKTYAIIDRAIDEISKSGLKFTVCPFETVMEGPYDAIMEVVKKVYETCFEEGAIEIIAHLKVHMRKGENVTIDEKMEKYH
jgi:uncharacterized protein YqgV (UPF0045/DUF77 family)